ncbi:MAG: hypothetical protein L3J56_06115, partial [Bacteroidales bacterium]|nr:hypothetical protein [Bacteroidales bacterium]
MNFVLKLTQLLFGYLGLYSYSYNDKKENINNKNRGNKSDTKNMYFIFQNVDNSYREINNSTVIDSKESNFEVSSENKNLK